MGLHHATLLRTLGRALQAEGHTVAYVLADPVAAWPLLADDGCLLLQAPRAPDVVRSRDAAPTPAVDFADLLRVSGFDAPDTLRPLVAAWDGLLSLVTPRLVIADYSPVLVLAARGRVPVAQVGVGFCLPPAHLPRFPALVPGAPPTSAHEAVLRAVQGARPGEAVTALPALFATEARFVTSLPELDPYGAERRDPVVGPLEPLPRPSPCERPVRYFAYLAADDPRTPDLVLGLQRAGLRGTIHLRGAPPDLRATLRGFGLDVRDAPLAMDEALRPATLVVHHGGAGTVHQAAAAGRLQLLLPRHLEQELNARALERLGVGVGVGRADAAEVTHALQALLGAPAPAEKARAWADALALREHDALGHVLARCRQLLA
jgi:hypothetical protein